MLQNLNPFSIPTSLLVISLFVGLSIYWILHRVVAYRATSQRRAQLSTSLGCQPPKRWRTRDPIFGLDFLYDQYTALKAHRLLALMASRFHSMRTRTATVSVLGHRLVATIEPENVKAVLATDFKSWSLSSERKKLLGEFLGEGIFTTDGEAWKHSREILRPAFTRSRIGDVEGFERHAGRLIECVRRAKGQMVDLQPLFFAFTMDVATGFLFGESSEMLARWGQTKKAAWENAGSIVSSEEFVDAFSYCTTTLEGGGEDSGWWGFLKLFLPNRKLRKAYKLLHRYVEGIVDKGFVGHANYKPDKSNYVFLHELIAQTSDRSKVGTELLNVLLAGRDTTASLLSNVWSELSKRPEVWSRLQMEVMTLDGALPSFEQLKELKYLNAILKESLRLYPVVPENNREAIEDTVLPLGGGEDERSPVLVPKGSLVHWSLWTMHRRQDLYGEDAEEFRPERWLDQGKEKGLRVGWEYLPFNGGPRVCIGQQFALMEACFVTIRLMQEFEVIESKDTEPWMEQISMTVTGKNGAKVVLKSRA